MAWIGHQSEYDVDRAGRAGRRAVFDAGERTACDGQRDGLGQRPAEHELGQCVQYAVAPSSGPGLTLVKSLAPPTKKSPFNEQ